MTKPVTSFPEQKTFARKRMLASVLRWFCHCGNLYFSVARAVKYRKNVLTADMEALLKEIL